MDKFVRLQLFWLLSISLTNFIAARNKANCAYFNFDFELISCLLYFDKIVRIWLLALYISLSLTILVQQAFKLVSSTSFGLKCLIFYFACLDAFVEC